MDVPVVHVIYAQTRWDAAIEALTDPEWHEDWFLAPCLVLGRRKGARCAWGDDPAEPVIEGRVTAYRPSQGYLAHTFAFTRAAHERDSHVEWDLEEQGDVVRIELRHHLGPDQVRTRDIIGEGWALALSRLKTLLETGKPMSWPEED